MWRFRTRAQCTCPPAPISRWRRLRADLVRGALWIFAVQLLVVQVSVVRGHSMQPSLRDGDRLVVDRVLYQLSGIERFDIIVLHYPCDPSVDFVKRVVGLPGDRVRLEHGELYVNGTRIEQSFELIGGAAQFPARTVPAGHYFVLGDNRPISCDSREFGVVPGDLVVGTVRARLWPLGRLSIFD